jgi:uncharacterized Rmd1/YagE family protein
MAGNIRLNSAKKNKDNEFYTRYEDIEKELKHHKHHLENKIIYCNCDDYRWSNFVKYFKDNFEMLRLKKLISTNYDIGEGAYKYEYDGRQESVTKLKSDGDFRSKECVELLKEADIVVSNPPFSLFRDYIETLKNYEKFDNNLF